MHKLKIAFAVVLGFIVLAPTCYFHAWTEPNYPSIKPWPSGIDGVGPHRPLVRQWKWRWLNWWYMNTEDDISGDGAWIWDDSTPPNLVTYDSRFKPGTRRGWIAYCWNARNNANNIKRPDRGDSLTASWTG